jgi:hypothetical protein
MSGIDPETRRLLRKVVARMEESHQFTGELPEDLLTELIELEMRDEDSSDDYEDPFVHAPLRPRPHSGAGAIAESGSTIEASERRTGK